VPGEESDMEEALEEIGHVSGEGGPLLLADLITVTSWRGVEEGGKDYERACDLLAEAPGGEGCAIAIEGGTGVVWEMEGGGTAGVFRRGQDYVVVTDDTSGTSEVLQLPAPLCATPKSAEVGISRDVARLL
jgi:hypothetical protein